MVRETPESLPHDLHFAGGDDKELIGRRALSHHDVALAVLHGAQVAR